MRAALPPISDSHTRVPPETRYINLHALYQLHRPPAPGRVRAVSSCGEEMSVRVRSHAPVPSPLSWEIFPSPSMHAYTRVSIASPAPSRVRFMSHPWEQPPKDTEVNSWRGARTAPTRLALPVARHVRARTEPDAASTGLEGHVDYDSFYLCPCASASALLRFYFSTHACIPARMLHAFPDGVLSRNVRGTSTRYATQDFALRHVRSRMCASACT
ncbi:hypothetical protein HYPSUDRAFT_214191 [Hypholoma sublateritium FD-334 SS-4]|uniref:Uncharacterized protein n=1 Tax=Hypholoma sublateritium (strain FD-334 SS-4) TaxID=945553 RepID=A0A0D2LCZ9_HYPSF|nr:hypothetical protein HYPSUDRAFT_214191 [Hypholoma sublateritium FD-334 SS-4]